MSEKKNRKVLQKWKKIFLEQFILTVRKCLKHWCFVQRYTYRVLQTIQMKLIFLCVWAEQAILGSAKTALKFKYEILMG